MCWGCVQFGFSGVHVYGSVHFWEGQGASHMTSAWGLEPYHAAWGMEEQGQRMGHCPLHLQSLWDPWVEFDSKKKREVGQWRNS